MSEGDRETMRTRWRGMAARRDWQLAHDEDLLLDAAMAQLAMLHRPENRAARQGVALIRAYGALLYAGLAARRERAIIETQQTCYKLSRHRSISSEDAQDIAQEMLARVLVSLEQLRIRQSFVYWMLRIQKDVERLVLRHERRLPGVSLDADPGGTIPGERDIAQDVEDALLSRELARRMRAVLSDIESIILVRWVVQGDKPREIAADLKLKPEAVRVHKSRALQKLGRDERFVAFLAELAALDSSDREGKGENDGTETGI